MTDIFEYADFRKYLEDWFESRKRVNPRFSHRAFAKRFGSNDPSLLNNVIRGRRPLTPERTEEFVRVLGLEGEAADCFRLLVKFGQAHDSTERQRALAELAVLRSRLDAPEIDSARFLYMSNRLYPALHELARCVGFRADPAWIARTLDCTEAEATDALDLLLRHGFLVPEGDGVVAADPIVSTPERVADMGGYGYQRQNHTLAGEVLERVWTPGSDAVNQTTFLGYTFPVPHHRLPEVRTRLWEAFLKVMHECDAWPEPDQVVQVNVQMFPVSRVSTRD